MKIGYNNDLKIIIFDFLKTLDVNQINQSTCLMENVESQIIEINFGRSRDLILLLYNEYYGKF